MLRNFNRFIQSGEALFFLIRAVLFYNVREARGVPCLHLPVESSTQEGCDHHFDVPISNIRCHALAGRCAISTILFVSFVETF